MRICVVGAKERDTKADGEYAVQLMRAIKEKTPNVLFITMLTHIGIGRYIRAAAEVRDPATGQFEFALIDCTVRLFTKNLSRSDLSQIFIARNATPYELSDMLYYLASEERRGPMEDLLQRFIDGGRPYKLLRPGDPIEVI
jgi:hypothetical protein